MVIMALDCLQNRKYTVNQSMIRKSGDRFSEKIMLDQRDGIMMRFRIMI
jgi:hypothetical protein